MLRNTSRIAVLGIAALAIVCTTAQATQFQIGGNLGSSMLFDKSAGANGQMDVDAFLGGANLLDLSFTTLYDINDGGNVTISGADLGADTSVGGLASADFNAGGTLQISGILTNFGVPEVFVDTLLIEGTLSAFSIDEDGSAENFLDTVGAIFTPTGGYLFDNGQVVNPYTFSLSIIGAQQQGGGVEDFSSDVQFTQSSTWVMTEIPEPSTMILLSGLIAGIALRRTRN